MKNYQNPIVLTSYSESAPSMGMSYNLMDSHVIGTENIHGSNSNGNIFFGSKPAPETTMDAPQISKRSSVGSESDQMMKFGEKKGKKMKKPRHAFKTRSQVDILDDGYRWRKYGQKAVKNNKFPRSYYRCTQQGCNVRKQIQRLTEDEEMVVTTYEGLHSHSIHNSTNNFEHILTQMNICNSF